MLARFPIPGASRQFDHGSLVHSMWKHFLHLDMEARNLRRLGQLARTAPALQVHVLRVPTDDNIADLPSRNAYALLGQLGGRSVPAVLAEQYLDTKAWKSLSLRFECLPEGAMCF